MKLSLMGLILFAGLPLAAHHSFDAKYDSSKSVTLTGVVTKVDWINPHGFIHINVEEKGGAVKTYAIELGPPYALTRGGWKRDTVKNGDTVTVLNGAPAKDSASNRVGATRDTFLQLSGGEKMVLR